MTTKLDWRVIVVAVVLVACGIVLSLPAIGDTVQGGSLITAGVALLLGHAVLNPPPADGNAA